MSGKPNAGGLPATITNSEGTVLALAQPGVIDPLANIVITDGVGTQHSVASGKNYMVPVCGPSGNVIVKNSDNTYNVSPASGATLILPDINITQPNGTVITFPAESPVLCTPIAALAPADLDAQLTKGATGQRNAPNGIHSTQDGQIISFAANDAGARQPGSLVDFSTLRTNNSFGNNNRRTDDLGLQVYANGVLIDHKRGLMWCITPRPAATWAAALSDASAFTMPTVLGVVTNFFVPTLDEYESIMTLGNAPTYGVLNYAPFNIPVSVATYWTSNTMGTNTANAIVVGPNVFPATSQTAKTNTKQYLLARNI